MQRRHLGHLAGVFAVGILLRVVLFDLVGIWGDYGFYAYDSRLILQGQTPFVDFVGRSPAYLFMLAAVREALGFSVRLPRAVSVAWWVLAALPVYAIARRVHSHRAGILAVVVMLWAPFSLVYGMWTNTQSLALCAAMSGLYVALSRDDWPAWVGVGALFGVAFLSRRSVIAIAVGVAAWVAVRAYRERAVGAGGRRLAAAAVGGVGVLAVGYGLLAAHAGGDWWMVARLARRHALGLVLSHGRGGFPMLVDGQVPPTTKQITSGRVPILNDLCQRCGQWTARTFAKTFLVTVPIAAVVPVVYLADWLRELFTDVQAQYLGGVLAMLGAYAIVQAARAGFFWRPLAILCVGLVAVAAYYGDPVDRSVLYDRRLQLLLWVLLWLAAAYLYRNRIIHTYYFMDFWPAVSVITGVVGVAVWRDWQTFVVHKFYARDAVVVAVVIGIAVATATAHPLAVILAGNQAGWFTPANIQEQGAALEAEVGPDEVLLVGHPTYVAGTDVRLYRNMPRVQLVATTWSGSRLGDGFFKRLERDLRDGSIDYVLLEQMTRQTLVENESVERAFLQHYCRVDDDHAFAQTGGKLYRYVDGKSDCPDSRRPTTWTYG